MPKCKLYADVSALPEIFCKSLHEDRRLKTSSSIQGVGKNSEFGQPLYSLRSLWSEDSCQKLMIFKNSAGIENEVMKIYSAESFPNVDNFCKCLDHLFSKLERLSSQLASGCHDYGPCPLGGVAAQSLKHGHEEGCGLPATRSCHGHHVFPLQYNRHCLWIFYTYRSWIKCVHVFSIIYNNLTSTV